MGPPAARPARVAQEPRAALDDDTRPSAVQSMLSGIDARSGGRSARPGRRGPRRAPRLPQLPTATAARRASAATREARPSPVRELHHSRLQPRRTRTAVFGSMISKSSGRRAQMAAIHAQGVIEFASAVPQPGQRRSATSVSAAVEQLPRSDRGFG